MNSHWIKSFKIKAPYVWSSKHVPSQLLIHHDNQHGMTLIHQSTIEHNLFQNSIDCSPTLSFNSPNLALLYNRVVKSTDYKGACIFIRFEPFLLLFDFKKSYVELLPSFLACFHPFFQCFSLSFSTLKYMFANPRDASSRSIYTKFCFLICYFEYLR